MSNINKKKLGFGIACILIIYGIYISIRPLIAEFHFRDAMYYMNIQKQEIATTYFEKAVQFAPWEDYYTLYLARNLKQAGLKNTDTKEQRRQLLESELYFKNLIQRDPINPWYKMRLAELNILLSRIEPETREKRILTANTQLKEAAENDSQNPIFLLAYGQYLFDQQQFDSAQPLLETVFEIDDKILSAPLLLGQIYLQKNNVDKAATFYGHVYAKNPKFQNIQIAMAQIHFLRQDYRQSLGMLQQFLSANPDHFKATEFLGFIYFHLQEWDQSLNIYKTLLEKAPNNFEVHRIMALCYKGKGNLKKAISILKRYINEHPENTVAPKVLNEIRNG